MNIREIRNVTLTTEPLPWLSFSALGGVLMLIGAAGGSHSEPLALTVGLLVFFWLVLLLIVAAHNARKWIEVEYIDDDGRLQHAYFSDGFILLSGGTIGHSMQFLALLSVQMSRWAERLKRWLSAGGRRSLEQAHETGSSTGKAVGCGGMMGGADLIYQAIRRCVKGRA